MIVDMLRTFVAVAVRPRLWATALVEAKRMIPNRWWARRPFLPFPDRSLLAFRAETQYGDATHGLDPGDIIVWLEWCRVENHRVAAATTRRHG